MIPRNAAGGHWPIRRESERYPGLVLELRTPFLTFRHGQACEVYRLAGGDAELVACAASAYGDFAMFEYARGVAQAYAKDLEARRSWRRAHVRR